MPSDVACGYPMNDVSAVDILANRSEVTVLKSLRASCPGSLRNQISSW